jgi:hypothetical protein
MCKLRVLRHSLYKSMCSLVRDCKVFRSLVPVTAKSDRWSVIICSPWCMDNNSSSVIGYFNPLNAELNPICHLLALLGVNHIFHVSGLRVKTYFSRSSETKFGLSGKRRKEKLNRNSELGLCVFSC